MGRLVACYPLDRRYWCRLECLAVCPFLSRSEKLTSRRPQDALSHCLKLTKPDMVLVDEERVELFTSMSKDLEEPNVYCWSELGGTRGGSSIKVG